MRISLRSLRQKGDIISASQQWCSRNAVIRRFPGFARLGDSQVGDTIVEVLIAMAIISLILTTAYSITAKNVLDLQNNAERVQGQHLVESQLEALKANDGIVGGTCFNSSGTPVSGAACNQTTTGSGASYQLSVVSAGPLYTVKAQWTSLGSHTTSTITMYYRLKN